MSNPVLLASSEGMTTDVAVSIYQLDDRLSVWLRVGVACLEILPEMLDDIIVLLSEADTFFVNTEEPI